MLFIDIHLKIWYLIWTLYSRWDLFSIKECVPSPLSKLCTLYQWVYTKIIVAFWTLIFLFLIMLVVNKTTKNKKANTQNPSISGLHHHINQNFLTSPGQEFSLVLDLVYREQSIKFCFLFEWSWSFHLKMWQGCLLVFM